MLEISEGVFVFTKIHNIFVSVKSIKQSKMGKIKTIQSEIVGKMFESKGEVFFCKTAKIISGAKLAIETYKRTIVLTEKEVSDVKILGLPTELDKKKVNSLATELRKKVRLAERERKLSTVKQIEIPEELSSLKKRKWSEEEDKYLIERLKGNKTYSVEELAKMFNRKIPSIYQRIMNLKKTLNISKFPTIGELVETDFFQGVIVGTSSYLTDFLKVQIVKNKKQNEEYYRGRILDFQAKQMIRIQKITI